LALPGLKERSRKRVTGSSATAGAGAVMPAARIVLRTAMIFFMVFLLNTTQSGATAREKRAGSDLIPKNTK
jgi:hypothetical protein